jgi:hypothetical protein
VSEGLKIKDQRKKTLKMKMKISIAFKRRVLALSLPPLPSSLDSLVARCRECV